MAHKPPFKGSCRLAWNSSIRKLQRAMRRGMVDPDRARIIKRAEAWGRGRAKVYRHASARHAD
jgi:hypothetical protein